MKNTKNTKKAVVAAAPAKKTATKKSVVAPVENGKVTLVAIGKTTYHYYRHFCKSIFTDGNVKSSFKKEEIGYNGTISVPSTQVVAAKKVVEKWRKDNPETVDIFSI